MRVVHNSLHDEVASQLRERIFAGELAPGMFLDEVRLAEQMNISRTPLREALKVLSVEGLVRHEPRRGCFVNEVTDKDLDEIFPVIALLEGRCAHEAARNASDADLQALEALHQKLSRHAKARRRPGLRTAAAFSLIGNGAQGYPSQNGPTRRGAW